MPHPPYQGLSGAISPGQWVRHPGRPDWGIGQVQSAIGDRVTVNFTHAGKVLVNLAVVALELADDVTDDAPDGAMDRGRP